VSRRVAFRVAVAADGDPDRELCVLPAVTLERHGDEVFLFCDDATVDDAEARLARAGLRAELGVAPPIAGARLVPAVMSDLLPVAVIGSIDRIALRPLDDGEAMSIVLRRRIGFGRRDGATIQRARSLLRGVDRMYAWRRVVWATPAALRGRLIRGAHPVVFDRDAVEHSPTRIGLVSDRRLALWLAA
jgi:hypothetical protein